VSSRQGEAVRQTSVAVVAIVASAGGIQALLQVLRDLPESLPAAIVVQVHLGGHDSVLTSVLSRRLGRRVDWVEDGAPVIAGRIVVSRPLRAVELLPNGTFGVSDEQHEVRDRPHDKLLTSVAQACGPHGLAVVLSGMGNDGAAGVRVLKKAGGLVIAQSPESAGFAPMPVAAAEAGADFVLSLDRIAPVVTDLVSGRPVRP
jgi:two-component system, chemotaxis family, protein-glutamate methylesterase/glutaminase